MVNNKISNKLGVQCTPNLFIMRHFILLMYFVVLFFSACTNIRSKLIESIDVYNVEDTLLYASEVFDTLIYIHLEENDSIRFRRIKEIVIDDDFLYILDDIKNKVYKYSSSGEYICKFQTDNLGLRSAWKISFDYTEKFLYLFDISLQTVFQFDTNGNLIASKIITHSPVSILFHEQSLFSYNPTSNLPFSDYLHLSSFSLSLDKIKNYHPNTKNIQESFKTTGYYSFFEFQDSITYWNSISDTVYRYFKGNFYPRYNFDYSKTNPPTQNYTVGGVNSPYIADYLVITNMVESKEKLYLNLSYSHRLSYITYDKKLNRSSRVVYKSLTNVYCFGIEDDINYLFPFWPKGISQGFLYNILQQRDLLTYLNSIEETKRSLILSKIPTTLYESLMINPNPIIVLAK